MKSRCYAHMNQYWKQYVSYISVCRQMITQPNMLCMKHVHGSMHNKMHEGRLWGKHDNVYWMDAS